MRKMLQSKVFLIMLALAIAGAAVLPFVGVEAGRDKLYVNKDASDKQDGSSAHPYKTIWQALDKADEDTDIFVAKGEYKESITIGKDVRIYGAGKDKTTIKAKDDDDVVVTMKHKSRIEGVTLKGGNVGVVVQKNSKADILKSVIKDNDREGVLILEGNHEDNQKVSIIDSLIKENGKTGVYAKERKVVIMDSTIQDNKGNGVFFEKDTTGWLEDNTIKENKKSGIVIMMDKSEVGIKKTSVYRNGREGMEINSYGTQGWVNVDRSKFYENGRYGIARVSRGNSPASLWGGLTVSANTQYWGNAMGNLSGVVRVK